MGNYRQWMSPISAKYENQSLSLALVFILYSRYSRKKQENNGVSDILSLFQRHCQTNDLRKSPRKTTVTV